MELQRVAKSLKAIRTLQSTWVASVPGEQYAITTSIHPVHARRRGGSTVTLDLVDGPIAAVSGLNGIHPKILGTIGCR